MKATSLFAALEMAPPDSILGLTEAFNEDDNPDKINLGVGVYKDEEGRTPVLACVKEAEQRLLTEETTKSYKPITGDAAYGRAVQRLLLGDDHPVVSSGRAVTSHAPGGTGALRVTGELLRRMLGCPKVWISTPTWANHRAVFEAAELEVDTYAYFDAATSSLDFEGMMATLHEVPAGEVVLLHGCCHNPTGVDPNPDQWRQLAELVAERRLLPLLDLAYQGLGDGLRRDAEGLRALCERVPELVVCSSFSKNFGLYNERVGAVTFIAQSPEAAQVVQSNVKLCIRALYSNPPAHGAAIVTKVLEDPQLRRQWEGELDAMRDRINGMRQLFANTLTKMGAAIDPSFIMRQRGMFSMSGLSKDQVAALRREHSIYIVGSGRMNVAGMTAANMKRLCAAVAGVL